MKNENSTSCLCGTVKIYAKPAKDNFGVCHCGMCRKWAGGPMLAVSCGTDVKFDGEQAITAYSSSPWGERGFCSKCGTHLFFRLKPTSEYILPVGLVQGGDKLKFHHQIFIDKKPANYSFAEKTENMTEAQFMAMYAPKN